MAVFSKKFSPADRTLLLRQLGLLTGTGLSVADAVQRLAQFNESSRVQAFCRSLLQQRDNQPRPGGAGQPKSEEALISILGRLDSSGEKLSQIFYEMADVNETTAGFRSSIAAALVYPVKLFLIALVLWTVILVFVIPIFDSLFAGFGSALPQPTQTILAISRIFQQHIVFIGAMLVALIFFTTVQKRTQRVFLWLFPGLRRLMRKMDVIHFSHALSIFLAAGLPLKDAVSNAAIAVPASTFSTRLQDLDANLSTAVQLTDALRNTGLFPTTLLGLTGLAGQVEMLPDIFRKTAVYLCKGFDSHLANAVKSFEIVMFFIVAVVVGAMVIAMYLPIFKMAGAIGG